MNLVIVESPTKAKTIAKFLGSGYKVESSFGHVRDLPEKEMGIDIANNFQPRYEILPKAKKNIAHLKKLADQAGKVILATDEDREGEAIAWHLAAALKTKPARTARIVFHEITKTAIEQALKNPRNIDLKLVDAQQARRLLDRLVGYELSPFLWKKVAKGLSAGRVQSVAVRLIVEREREIKNFVTQEYWSVVAFLENEQKTAFAARLYKIKGKVIDKLEIKSQEQAQVILLALVGANYQVSSLVKKQLEKMPPKPFTTSSLQQTANRWLGFSARQTMVVAQQLYEQGFITYMRTDSLNLADKFLLEAAKFLMANYGKNYALSQPHRYRTTSRGAQEAHEAIRPTEVEKTPEKLAVKLDKTQTKLYRLIWQRSLACQMPPAEFESTVAEIAAQKTDYLFKAVGQVLKFDGYLKIYPERNQQVELPKLKIKEKLNLLELKKEQHFTKPPARFSDAGLVKVLERYGIGRPSTYAPTIATILGRNYVKRDEAKRLYPTPIAEVVNDLLVNHFPKIVDYQFTAQMEDNLDKIADGKKDWQPVVGEFYHPFHQNLANKYQEINKKDILPEKKTDQRCEKCGSAMVVKTGRYGPFLACSAFPRCRNIKSLASDKGKANNDKIEEAEENDEQSVKEVCEKCGQPMVVKKGPYGPFLACQGYPQCKNVKKLKFVGKPTGIVCPGCGQGQIVPKRSRKGIFYACDQYPNCQTAFWEKPTGQNCLICGSLLVENKRGEIKCSNKDCEG